MTDTNSKKEATVEDVINAAKNRNIDNNKIKMDNEPAKGTQAYIVKKALENGETLIGYQKIVSQVFDSDANTIEDDAYYLARSKDNSFHNNHGSITLKEDGTITMGSEVFNSFRMNPSGKTAFTNTEMIVKTNAITVEADDIIVNNHKLNNKLYELADFKKVLNTYDDTPKIAGGLTMLGTVMVKAWEPTLKRYVLVRRLINIPVFSPSLGGKEINPGIKVSSDMSKLAEWKKQINTSGITNSAQLLEQMWPLRNAAIALKEKATAEANEKLKEENAKKQATSMTSMTGQNPATVGASSVAMSSGGEYGGGGGSFTGDKSVRYEGTSNDMAKEAWAEAQRIAKDLNIDPTIIYGQWYHESGGFSSTLAMENCNLGGLTQTQPNGEANKQPDGNNYYMEFKSIHDYAEYFKRIWGPDVKGVSSAEQYASNLKREGYYGDSYDNYVAGIYGGMKHIPSSSA